MACIVQVAAEVGGQGVDDFFHGADKRGAFLSTGMARKAQAPDVATKDGDAGVVVWRIATGDGERSAAFVDVQVREVRVVRAKCLKSFDVV